MDPVLRATVHLDEVAAVRSVSLMGTDDVVRPQPAELEVMALVQEDRLGVAIEVAIQHAEVGAAFEADGNDIRADLVVERLGRDGEARLVGDDDRR